MIDAFFEGVEWFYTQLFAALPSTLRVLAFSILVATLSYCAARRPGRKWLITRILITIFVGLWAAWKVGALGMLTIEDQVFQLIGIVLLLVVVIVKFYLHTVRIKGIPLFRYWTLWVFYAVAFVFYMVLEYSDAAVVHSLVFFMVMFGLICINKATGGRSIR